MADDVLQLPPRSLLIFIDETGNEDLSDPQNPTFGRGGCGALMADYQQRIAKPWRRLKREGWEAPGSLFLRPILSRPALRRARSVASMTSWCSHFGVSQQCAIRHVAKSDVDVVALLFEDSEKGNKFMRRDHDSERLDLKNIRGGRVEVEGCFMPKGSMEPGLEVADLIAHTAGRQPRHELAGKHGYTTDFQWTYWHRPASPEFMTIDAVEIAGAVQEGQAAHARLGRYDAASQD